ncbi:MAG: MBL fold metallo-hydrolase [Desulfobacterales bacterium]
MKITLLYDNYAWDKRLAADWGFAALLEVFGRTILFDTGARGQLLLDNMKLLGISPQSIDEIFISHDHWDHTGGLSEILERNPVQVFVPDTITTVKSARQTIPVSRAAKIHENIYSTGTLKGIEHSMCILQDGKVVVIAGCSHPGVEAILSAASEIGPPSALIGGLHGFYDFQAISQLEIICATHCTEHIREINSRFPSASIPGGAGKVIKI